MILSTSPLDVTFHVFAMFNLKPQGSSGCISQAVKQLAVLPPHAFPWSCNPQIAGRPYLTLNPGPVAAPAKSRDGTAYIAKAMPSPAALQDKDGKPPPPAASEDIDGKRRRRRICVCTRVHQNNANRPVDMAKVISDFFLLAVLGLASTRGMRCTID